MAEKESAILSYYTLFLNTLITTVSAL